MIIDVSDLFSSATIVLDNVKIRNVNSFQIRRINGENEVVLSIRIPLDEFVELRKR